MKNLDDLVCDIEKSKALTINGVIKRYVVVYDYPCESHQFMETVWTDDEINKVEMWRVKSEHKNKKQAQAECERLNALQRYLCMNSKTLFWRGDYKNADN